MSPAFRVSTVVLVACFTLSLVLADSGSGCEGFDAQQQPFDPTAVSTANMSDAESGFRIFERFNFPFPSFGSAVRAWGVEVDFDSPTFLCSVDDTANFNVAFWGESTSIPDLSNQIAAVEDVAAVEVDTGESIGGVSIFRIDIDLGGDVDITGTFWMSIERMNNADGCFWLWVDETVLGTYDDRAYQQGSGFLFDDRPFCLAGMDSGDGGNDVPAVSGIGVVLTVALLLGAGLYFGRRCESR